MQPLVSIVTPVYNLEKFITKTMDSVRAQSLEAWELLLVEDGSKDESVSVIRNFPPWCRKKNAGITPRKAKNMPPGFLP